MIDWVDHDRDGGPSIGLVMVHAEHQRRGYGREAVLGLIATGRQAGWTRLRASALAADPATAGLYEATGMREIQRRRAAFAVGERSVAVFELEL